MAKAMPGRNLSVRVDYTLSHKIERRAEQDGIHITEVIRRALKHYLTNTQSSNKV